MNTPKFPWARTAIIAVCVITVSTGCFLDRRPRPSPAWSQLEPREYCPGDQISAGYDFLSPESCPASLTAEQCNLMAPIITIASTDSPETFPARTFPQSLRRGFTFTAPNAPSITAKFSDSRGIDVTVPQFTPQGDLFGIPRGIPEAHQRTIRKMDETQYINNQHNEMCMGGTVPTYAAAMIRHEGMSPNARLIEVCNDDTVAFKITLTREVPGEMYERNLNPGECVRMDEPGIPESTRLATTLGIKLMSIPENACVDIKDRRTYIATKVKFGCG